jgi:hypothetical protein
MSTAAEDNSFNEYIGDATTQTWTPKKDVFADLKHIARSAQYHALLSMSKVSIPTIIQKASAQGTVLSVREKIRGGKPVFEVILSYAISSFCPTSADGLQPMMMRYSCVGCFVAIVAVSLAPDRAFSQTPSPSSLQLEIKIPLGDVKGRIDHMAIDLPRRRLFVAELGNDTVGVVDLNEQKVRHVITGLKEPQGIGYVSSSDTLFVANAGDGSVLLFRGAEYAAAGRIDLGDDADNIRVDSASNRVFVGYGSGALAVIDPATNGKIADIPLQAHPESFQLARSDRRTS